METSAEIGKVGAALAKAQGKITGALKSRENPFYESKYADLASCWDAARDALSENELAVVQTIENGADCVIEWETTDKKTGDISTYKVATKELVVVTTLIHSSGEWIRSKLPMIPRDATPQGYGSAIAYGRRYGFTAMVGVAQVDDDGNAASGKTGAPAKEIATIGPGQIARLEGLIQEVKSNRDSFLRYLGVASLDQIPIAKFSAAVAALESKRPKVVPGKVGA
jgi:hypothetical protein